MKNINLFQIANHLADIAAKIAQNYFRQDLSITLKGGISPVTQADLEIEAAIRTYLTQEFPDHSILGEEFDSKQTNSEYTWVIDPIDGTTSFACGKPTFCTLIALLKNKIPILGIIDQPITQERWCGIKGEQSTFNHHPCRCHSLSISSPLIKLSCTTPEMFTIKEQKQKFALIRKFASFVSYGGDAYAYGLLAQGYIDIVFEADLKFYDVAALIPIIEGVGGYITDWEGNSLQFDTFNGTVLATKNQNIQQKILELLQNPES